MFRPSTPFSMGLQKGERRGRVQTIRTYCPHGTSVEHKLSSIRSWTHSSHNINALRTLSTYVPSISLGQSFLSLNNQLMRLLSFFPDVKTIYVYERECRIGFCYAWECWCALWLPWRNQARESRCVICLPCLLSTQYEKLPVFIQLAVQGPCTPSGKIP